MALILVAISVVLLAGASAAGQTNESDTCVWDARAALDAQWREAFGPEATVQKQKSIETIELEALERIEKWFSTLKNPGEDLVFMIVGPIALSTLAAFVVLARLARKRQSPVNAGA